MNLLIILRVELGFSFNCITLHSKLHYINDCELNFSFYLWVLLNSCSYLNSTFQLLLTKELVHHLMRHTEPEAAAARHELKLFKQHILLNPVSFSPWQLMTFNRATLVTVSSVWLFIVISILYIFATNIYS